MKNVIEEDKRIISEKMRTISPMPPEGRVRAMIEMAIDVSRRNSELRAKLSTIKYYVAETDYISESIRFYQEVVRYNLPQIPGRDMNRVSYMAVNAFIGLINTISIDQPNAIHDSEIVSEMMLLLEKYLETDSLGAPKNHAELGNSTARNKGDFL